MTYRDGYILAGLVMLFKGADPKVAAGRAASFVEALYDLEGSIKESPNRGRGDGVDATGIGGRVPVGNGEDLLTYGR